jgi:hypothetical protein
VKKLVYIWLLGSVWLAARALATDFYISPSGNNTNTGTSTVAPWKDTANANARVWVAGDRLFFQGSVTHTGNLVFDSSDCSACTSNLPVTIGSYGTGRATLSSGTNIAIDIFNSGGYIITNLNLLGAGRGTGQPTSDHDGIVIWFYSDNKDRSFIRIDSVDISNFGRYGISILQYDNNNLLSNVRITNASLHDNGQAGLIFDAYPTQIQNIYIGSVQAYNNYGLTNNNNAESGIVVGAVNGGTIENCVAYNNGVYGDNGYGFYAYTGNNLVFQFNESYANHTRLFDGGGGFAWISDVVNSKFQYNYSHNNDGPGYRIEHDDTTFGTTNNTVRYNISENDVRKTGAAAVDIFGHVVSTEVYNNTIFLGGATNPVPSVVRVYTTNGLAAVQSLHFRNNIFQTTNDYAVQVNVSTNQLATATDLLFQDNAYYSSGAGFYMVWSNVLYTSLAAWQSATGQEKIGGFAIGFNVDPRLSNPGFGGTNGFGNSLTNVVAYRLQAGSPLIDDGLGLLAFFGINPGTRDFYSNSIPQGAGFDVGAHDTSPTISLIATAPTASEPGTNTGTFAVTRTGGTFASLGVQYSIAGMASNGVDYTHLSGTVTIPAGTNTVNVSVAPIDDYLGKCTETVSLTLLTNAIYIVSTSNNDTVTILDFELPTVSIVASLPIASETGPTPGQWTIMRTGCTNTVLTASYDVAGTAVAGTDYQSLSGLATIPAGATNAVVTLTPLGDDLPECAETAVLTLRPSPDYIVGSASNSTVTIVAKQPVVSIMAIDPVATEFGCHAATFSVTDVGCTDVAVTVMYAIGGTASNGVRYVALSGTVTIPPGTNATTVAVTPIPDNVAEGDQTVVLSLAANPAYMLGNPTTATATVFDKPVDDWRLNHFGAAANNSLIAGDLADPDGDGLPNLLEYALGLDPLTPDTAGLPQEAVASGFLTLIYTRPSPPPVDISYDGQVCDDLASWTSNVTEQVTDNGNSTATVTLSDTVAVNAATKRFIRLDVQRIQP